MEIIPVIDMLKGKVVQASGDERGSYQPLQSQLTMQTDMVGVVADLLAFHPFKTLYIADLDAIMGTAFEPTTYIALAKQFPRLMFWLDAGIKDSARWQSIAAISNMKPIIASETLQDKSLLADPQIRRQSILSLDYQQGKLLGGSYLTEKSHWPRQVILMSLDVVGSNKGPDLGLLRALQKTVNRHWIMAGGVRDADDLNMLRGQGVSGVLVASALHAGVLDPSDLSHQI